MYSLQQDISAWVEMGWMQILPFLCSRVLLSYILYSLWYPKRWDRFEDHLKHIENPYQRYEISEYLCRREGLDRDRYFWIGILGIVSCFHQSSVFTYISLHVIYYTIARIYNVFYYPSWLRHTLPFGYQIWINLLGCILSCLTFWTTLFLGIR